MISKSRRIDVLLFLMAWPIMAAAQSEPAAPVAGDLIVSNVTLLTMTPAGVLENRYVYIRNAVVSELAPERRAHWPANVPVVDGSGRYLLPALHDLHVHVFDPRDLEVYALRGIATVRNMDGWDWHLGLAREAEHSQAWMARLITTGAQYQPPLVDSLASLESQVAAEAKRGYPWIKVYDGLAPEQLEILAIVSSRHGMRVTGHLPGSIASHEAIMTGAYADVAHAEELLHGYHTNIGSDNSKGRGPYLDRLASAFNANGTALVTTLVNNRMILEQVRDLGANLGRHEVGLASPLLQAFWRSDFNPYAGDSAPEAEDRLRRDQRALVSLVAGLHHRGVTLLAGTDAPNPTTVPAESLYAELELLVAAGLSPAEAIRTATTSAARHLGEPGNGRIAPGARADFLLLEANPLEDIAHLRRQSGVVLRGRFLDRQEIAARLAKLRMTYAAEAEILTRLDPASAAAILKALDSSPDSPPALSPPALTSLVWMYMKFQNRESAEEVARRLVSTYPTPASRRVLSAVLGE